MTDRPMTPGVNDEGHENKLVVLAMNQAQKQLEDGTASSQVLTHFLRLGSTRAKIELEKIKLESKLLEEKIASEKHGQEITAMMSEVLAALASYSYKPPGGPDADVY